MRADLPLEHRRAGRLYLILPYPLLAVATIAVLAYPDWGVGQGLAVVLALAVVAGVHRWWGQRRQVAAAPWFLAHVALSAALVTLAPLYCIYAFCGYFDAGRLPTRTVRTVAMVPVAAIVALGQTGGLNRVAAAPWLFLVLFLVNAGLGPLMAYLDDLREADITRREQALRQLAAEQRRNTALHAQLLTQAREAGVLDERARLSREIHDTVAQGLLGIITQLEAIDPDDPPAAWQPRVDRAGRVARESLAEARRAIHALGSPQLDTNDLPEALRGVVRRQAEAHGLQAVVQVDGQVRPVPQQQTLLRITQEALSNIVRHSGARHAAVTLSYTDDEVRLDVRDDGRGFDPALVQPGAGLTGMRERLTGVGGTLEIEAAPGDGCALSAAIPAGAAHG